MGSPPQRFNERYRARAERHGGADDQEHMGFLEAEHALDAKPRGHFGFDQYDPEINPDNQCKGTFHDAPPQDSKLVMPIRIKPPAKKLIVATRLGHFKLERPMIECPEVQPSA